MPINPLAFFTNGDTHSSVAEKMGIHPCSLSVGISNGSIPFKQCRIKVGKRYIYDWDACVEALKAKSKSLPREDW